MPRDDDPEQTFRQAVARRLAETLTPAEAESLGRLQDEGAPASVLATWLDVTAPSLRDLLVAPEQEPSAHPAGHDGERARPGPAPRLVPQFLRLCALVHERFEPPPCPSRGPGHRGDEDAVVLAGLPCRTVARLGPDGLTVEIVAVVTPTIADASPGVPAYLLRVQGRLPLGRFLPDHDEGCVLEHSLPWDGLTADALRATADQLAQVADALGRNLLAARCIAGPDDRDR